MKHHKKNTSKKVKRTEKIHIREFLSYFAYPSIHNIFSEITTRKNENRRSKPAWNVHEKGTNIFSSERTPCMPHASKCALEHRKVEIRSSLSSLFFYYYLFIYICLAFRSKEQCVWNFCVFWCYSLLPCIYLDAKFSLFYSSKCKSIH